MTEHGYAIETRDLTKQYGRHVAVDMLNLRVPRGSVFAFLGRNGAGKTTTIRMLLDLLAPTWGTVKVLGHSPMHDSTYVKQWVGYVAEGQRMYDWMTVSQIMWFCSGFYANWDKAYADQLMKQLDLPPKQKLQSLSRGMQAKVALLLAMAHRPELLILDEPTAGLDVGVRRNFLEGVIDLMQQEGRTVFFSTHLVHEVERIADWVGIMEAGRLIECRPIEELKACTKQISIVFRDAPPSVHMNGVVSAQILGHEMKLVTRDFTHDTLSEIDKLKPLSVSVEDMPLEDIFIAYTAGNG